MKVRSRPRSPSRASRSPLRFATSEQSKPVAANSASSSFPRSNRCIGRVLIPARSRPSQVAAKARKYAGRLRSRGAMSSAPSSITPGPTCSADSSSPRWYSRRASTASLPLPTPRMRVYPCRDTGETISPSTCSSPRGSRDWNSETNPLPTTTAVGATSAARPVRRPRPRRERTAGSKLPCSMARTSAPSVRCTSMPWRSSASFPAASAQASGGTRAAVPSACSTVPGRDVAGVWRGAFSVPRSHPARQPQQTARAHVSVRPRLMRRHRTESAIERPSAQRGFFVTLPRVAQPGFPSSPGTPRPSHRRRREAVRRNRVPYRRGRRCAGSATHGARLVAGRERRRTHRPS